MTDSQTIYEFRLACYKPGCPICAIIQHAGAQYIEGTFNESMLDPAVRQKLVDSLGFCYEHSWQSITMKLSDALGHAILYQDLLKDLMRRISDNETISGSQLANALDPMADCPACRIEEATLERIIDSVTAAFHNQDFITDFTHSSGICFPHLKRILPNLDRKRKEIVLAHQLTCADSLKNELAEFIRKSDYRFRNEIIGKEGDSYKRAAEMVKGKHRPAEQRDLL
jgi:hypothetical protein